MEEDLAHAKTLARILKRLEEDEEPLEKLLGKLQSCAKELRTIANRFDELVEAFAATEICLPTDRPPRPCFTGVWGNSPAIKWT